LKDIHITSFSEEDWGKIKAIYKEGMETGYSTLETQVPTWENWEKNQIKESVIFI
jgi:phosphinothricin acetyltransferase